MLSTSTCEQTLSPTATLDGNLPILFKPPERCRRHSRSRMGTGPTGRKPIWVIADVCRACGIIVEVFGKPSWRSLDWVRRWNARIEREIDDATG